MKLQNIIIKYLMSGSPHDGGKHGPGRIVTGETGFAHAGPIVDHEGSNVFVTHDEVGGLQAKTVILGRASGVLSAKA